MSRPEVSVVMPFGGPAGQAPAALAALGELDAEAGDELILADNSGGLAGAGAPESSVLIIPAPGERSPAHARNVGAAHATREWILFLDADCRPLGRLLEAYLAQPIGDDVGAVAGELIPAPGGATLAARYGAARNFLSAQTHVRHPFLPRAAAANLLVRRSALEQIGGFYEGVRAAEDTDFTWRLQRAGWKLIVNDQAVVEHRYRATLGELRRQWRGYAAGRAWLGRRYEGFTPEPAALRGFGRARRLVGRGVASAGTSPANGAIGQRRQYLALDALLALEELAGFALSNRPAVQEPRLAPDAEVVLVADRFPGRGDPLVELAQALGRARVEAAARPDVPDLDAVHRLDVRYREDDGAAVRALAGLRLLIRHPVLVAQDLLSVGSGEPSTWALAPAVLRLGQAPQARVHPLGGQAARGAAQRIARLSGRPLEE